MCRSALSAAFVFRSISCSCSRPSQNAQTWQGTRSQRPVYSTSARLINVIYGMFLLYLDCRSLASPSRACVGRRLYDNGKETDDGGAESILL